MHGPTSHASVRCPSDLQAWQRKFNGLTYVLHRYFSIILASDDFAHSATSADLMVALANAEATLSLSAAVNDVGT
ncbi:hypothetical protein CC2G_004852 [Coprinopsis cinerea AmutBmut pab1-1]|nr:hypothetical protein CC2G_004852 [Coprinopsis cinerea AmutBmut pab1-1]